MMFLMNKIHRTIYVMNQKQLQALPKKELIDRCMARQLDTRGTKFDLVKRLIATTENGVIHSIIHRRPVITIDRNEFNHYVHKDTLLVFDPVSQMVIGRKEHFNAEETHNLTYTDIEQCMRYKFRYRTPDNLADATGQQLLLYQKTEGTDPDLKLKRRLLEIRNPILIEEEEDDEDQDESDV